MCDEMDQVAKQLSVEVNDSTKLRAPMYEQAATYRRCLTATVAIEWTLAKTRREEMENNTLERDCQWQKWFGESIADKRVEMEKKLEVQDQAWQKWLELVVEDTMCKLREQAEQQEHSYVQMERKMKESQEKDVKPLEERLTEVQVSCVSVHW